jgi:hypothetical protein
MGFSIIYIEFKIGIFVDFALLIGAEGMRLLRDKQAKGDPTGVICAEEAPCLPRGKRVPRAEIIANL